MEEWFLADSNSLKDKIRYSLLRADTLDEYGLLDGKLGMAILFYEYSRFAKDNLFEEFADELIESIADIPYSISLDMEHGLSGIAWGIVYLFDRGFLNGNIDEILESVDEYLLSKEYYKEEDARAIVTYMTYRQNCFAEQCCNYITSNCYGDVMSHLKSTCKSPLYNHKLILKDIYNNNLLTI